METSQFIKVKTIVKVDPRLIKKHLKKLRCEENLKKLKALYNARIHLINDAIGVKHNLAYETNKLLHAKK